MPVMQAREIERDSTADLLQMGFGQPQIARMAHAKGAHGLGDGAFHPSTQRIALFESRGLLLLAAGMPGLIAGLGRHGQLARLGGRARTTGTRWTGGPRLCGKAGANAGMAAVIWARVPDDPDHPLPADGPSRRPLA